MSDELPQVRDQVVQRLERWGQSAVPAWKYAVLLARSFEAVRRSADTEAGGDQHPAFGRGVPEYTHLVGSQTSALADRLLEIAHRWAGGGRHTPAQADFAAE